MKNKNRKLKPIGYFDCKSACINNNKYAGNSKKKKKLIQNLCEKQCS